MGVYTNNCCCAGQREGKEKTDKSEEEGEEEHLEQVQGQGSERGSSNFRQIHREIPEEQTTRKFSPGIKKRNQYTQMIEEAKTVNLSILADKVNLNNTVVFKHSDSQRSLQQFQVCNNSLMNQRTLSHRSIAKNDVRNQIVNLNQSSFISDKSSLRNSAALIQKSNTQPQGNTLHEMLNNENLIMKQEKKFQWTKLYLVGLFADICNIQTYKNLLNTPNIKLYVNEKGTPFYTLQPLFKTEYIFDSRYGMEQLVHSMHNSDHRTQWDKNLKSQNLIKKINRIELIHIQNQPHFLASQKRDIFEKKFGFAYRPMIRSEDNHSPSWISGGYEVRSDIMENYFFFSSMDDKEVEKECPIPKDTTRTQVYFGMHKFEIIQQKKAIVKNKIISGQLGDDYEKCVKVTMLMQCDPKLSKLKYGLYKTALPNLTKQFYENLVKHLNTM